MFVINVINFNSNVLQHYKAYRIFTFRDGFPDRFNHSMVYMYFSCHDNQAIQKSGS